MKKYGISKWLAGLCLIIACSFFGGENVSAAGQSTGDFVVKGGNYGTDYSYANNVLTILTEMPLTVSGETTKDCIQVNKDIKATLTLNGVSIRVSKGCALDLQDAEVTLKLRGENSLKSGMRQPGIFVAKDGKLTISGGKNDSLSVTGGAQAAGIGSNNEESCGDIEISSGTVYATGGMKGAGIGGGSGQDCGSLVFSGGRIVAQGGSQAADVGAAQEAGKSGGISLEGSILYADEMTYDLSFKNGILVSGNQLEVQGRQTLAHQLDIQENQTLLIPGGSELTIPSDMECTNEGIICVYGNLYVNGQLMNEGEIVDYSGLLADDSGITGNNVTEGDLWDIQMENGDVTFTANGYEQNGMEFEPDKAGSRPYHIYGNGRIMEHGIVVEKGVSVNIVLEDVNLESSGNDYALTLRQNAKVVMELRGENRFHGGGNALTGSVLTEKNASLEVKGSGTLALESEGNGKIVLYGSGQVDESWSKEDENDGEVSDDENPDEEDRYDEQDGEYVLDVESGETVSASDSDLNRLGYQDVLCVSVDYDNGKSEVTLERDVLEQLADEGAGFKLACDGKFEAELDSKAVEDMLSATNGDVTLVVKPFTLTEQFPAAKAAVDSRPVYDIQVYDQGYREKRLKNVNFQEGKAVVSIPYRPTRNEKAENLYMIYVGANNMVEWLTDSFYDAESGMITSRVQHFSVYAVGYKPPVTVSGNGV